MKEEKKNKEEDNYRYCRFSKLKRQSTAGKFQLITTVSSVAIQHIYRVYYQSSG